MNFKIVKNQIEWNNLTQIFSSLNDICNSYEYYSLFALREQIELFYYYEDNCGLCIPYIKKKIPNSNYFDIESVYGYSGPLSSSEDNGFLQNAYDSFKKYCNKENIIAFFIRFNPILQNQIYVDSDIKILHDRNIVLLHIKRADTYKNILERYSKSTLKNCKKAIDKGLIVEYSNSLKFVKQFYKIYGLTMNRLNAEEFYRFDENYFLKLHQSLENNFLVLLAFDKEKIIHGGALILYTDDCMYYFLSGTTDIGRKTSAAYLLRDTSVRVALDKGIKVINFGGGRTIDEDDSLYVFKKGFSNDIEKFHIGKVIFNEKAYKEICNNWEKNNPALVIKYKNILLKYRMH